MSKFAVICVDEQPNTLQRLKSELRDILADEDRIATAQSGAEALEQLATLQQQGYEIALVLANDVLAGMTGDELLCRIHQVSPPTLTILTGQPDLAGVARALRDARLFRLLPTPWQPEELRQLIVEGLQAYRQTRESVPDQLIQPTSEVGLCDILDSAIAAIASIHVFPDFTWDVVYRSAGYEQLFGYAIAAMAADKTLWMSRLPAEDLQAYLAQLQADIPAERTGTVEYRFQRQDGSLCWISETYSSRWDEAAHCWIVTTVDVDISNCKTAEIALEQSKAKLNDILHNAGAAITRFRVFANLQLEYEFYSHASEAVFGYSAAELMQGDGLWMSCVHPEDLERVILPAFEHVYAERPASIEYRFRQKDGSWRWISETSVSKRQEEADGWIVTCVAIDISEKKRLAAERKANQAARLESQQRYESLVENIPGVVYRCLNDPDWTLEYISGDIVNLLGYPAADFLLNRVRSFASIDHPEDADRVHEEVDRAVAAGEPYNVEYRCIHADGSIRWIEDRGMGIFNAQGELRLEGVLLDITDRKRQEAERKAAEEALGESETRFRRLTENVPGVIFRYVTHADGSDEFAYVSPRCREVFGVEATAAMQSSTLLWSLVHPEDVASLQASIATCIQSGLPPWFSEHRIIRPDGQLRWIRTASQGSYQENGDIFWDGFTEDISERKSADLLLQWQSQREHALNSVIHSIRNSLELDQIFAIAAAEIVKLLNTDSACILQYFPERNCWQQIAKYYNEHIKRPLVLGAEIPDWGNPFASQLKQREVVRIDHTQMISDEVNRAEAQKFPGSWLLVPLIVQDQVWGCFTAMKEIFPSPWTEGEVDMAKAIADQLAIAIQQANLFGQLQQELAERKTAQAALQESEWHYRSLVNHIPGAVFRCGVDADATSHYLSQQFADISGYPVTDFVNSQVRTYNSIIHPEDLQSTDAAIEAAIADNRPYEIQYRIIHADGQVRWLLEKGQCAPQLPGQSPLVEGVIIDITENMQQEAKRQQAEAQVYQQNESLRIIIEGTAAKVGQDFFQACTRALSEALEVRYAFISECLDQGNERVRMLAFWSGAGFVMEGYEYDLAGTPCQGVYGQAVCRYPDSVQTLFPADQDLVALGVESYLAVPIRSDRGEFYGHIAVMDTQPLAEHPDLQIQILQLVSSRVAAEIEQKKAELEVQQALEEKTTLLQEVHHRVKNNLQVISSLLHLQARRVDDTQTLSVLEDSQNRVTAMSLVHQSLYQSNNFAGVNFGEYIRTLTSHLFRTYNISQSNVQLQVTVDPAIALPLDQAIPCGLILNELISNALKHGFNQGTGSGKLWVALTQSADHILTFTVSNEGQPLPAEFDLEKSHSMGLKLVKVLTEQLQGNLQWHRGDVTTFSLCFRCRRSDQSSG